MSMFCRQCEQAAKGTGCDVMGVCGKSPEVAALLDLLLHGLKGLAIYADKARALDARNTVADMYLIEGLFTTVTNVDFDPVQLAGKLRRCYDLKEQVKALYEGAWREKHGASPAAITDGPAAWVIADTLEGLVAQGKNCGVMSQHSDPDILSSIEIIIYGLKGMAAYANHACILGKTDEEVFAFFHSALAATTDTDKGLMDFVGIAMECGKLNIKVMGILNEGHVERYGHPVPTKVQLGTRKNKGILVSGHDLRMLEEILKQTEGKGIDIYTHGEMIPAHGYPALKKYPHLYANFGGAWQDQHKEFQAFPGAIIFNTNCIQRPADSYKDRLFTWGEVGWPGVKHIAGWHFDEVINKALECPDLPDAPGKEILTGFGHNAVLGVADKVIEAVKGGAVKHFFLIGGCDGAKSGRNYYTEFAEKVPKDCIILTLACGKYRFNKLEFGDIGGIPRLLDVGQCNDAYSAVQIALALAGAFNCGVNDLPLSFILSWYEQKAHVILLSLLYLGIRDIKLGPMLPAYLSPNVLQFLVSNFNIGQISTVDADLKASLGQ
ncbi:iron-sulfur-oxygen hybrid cluster protein (prismane) [Citrifermentans bemidjiense Bem]|uniref:Hydroxylamine reductase n=1 Tax=Citrifermentans bemidjiense (strain ATCC BAA-1014 / DSM 16622 / JCM 12645 / Bem) TaxID=404380 RepID=B5EHZ4_CITBB|nr:hydroxylamine reductase [Citrifermentans bemidjiense]ACH38258.1 iron-sulfur-oxygen hybrid cluster protein (prismane) [Citrifermentans bemidjiense Bem]